MYVFDKTVLFKDVNPPKKRKVFFSIFFSFEKIPEESMQKLKFG